MDIARDPWSAIGSIVMLLFVTYCFRAWIRRGGWIPRYFHILALVLYGVGFLALRALSSASGVTLLAVSLLFPAIAYILFIALGGVEAAAEARERKGT